MSIEMYKKLAENYPIYILENWDDYYVVAVLNDNLALMYNALEENGNYKVQYLHFLNITAVVAVYTQFSWRNIYLLKLKEALEKGYITKTAFYKLRWHIARYIQQVHEEHNELINVEEVYKTLTQVHEEALKLIAKKTCRNS